MVAQLVIEGLDNMFAHFEVVLPVSLISVLATLDHVTSTASIK